MSGPHDIYFKETFKQKIVAKQFLQAVLDKQLLILLNLESLALEDTSYTHKELSEQFSDVVYTCKLKDEPTKEVFISLLFEHKSYYDPWTSLQLLKYMTQVWERDRSQANKKELTPIIPILVYHGNRSWKHRSISDSLSFSDEVLDKYVPDFEYVFSHLDAWPEESLKAIQNNVIYNILLALRDGRNKDQLFRNVGPILNIIDKQLNQQQQDSIFRSTVVYLFSVTKESNRMDLKEVISNQDTIHKEKFVSAYDGLKIEVHTETIRNGIKIGLSPSTLAQLTGLSIEKVEAIIKQG